MLLTYAQFTCSNLVNRPIIKSVCSANYHNQHSALFLCCCTNTVHTTSLNTKRTTWFRIQNVRPHEQLGYETTSVVDNPGKSCECENCSKLSNFSSFLITFAVLPVEFYFLDRKMPQKKKNKTKKQCNGFYMYMMDKKRGFEQNVMQPRSDNAIPQLAHPGWKVGLYFFF